jgi:hypothetical protein
MLGRFIGSLKSLSSGMTVNLRRCRSEAWKDAVAAAAVAAFVGLA